MLGRALTSVFWGIIADRYGRKPVIVFGTVAVLVLIFAMLLNAFPNALSSTSYALFFCNVGLYSTLSLALV